MDRKIERQGAFTILELIIVIVVVATLVGLAFTSYSKWKHKTQIERDTHRLASTFEKLRMEAFVEKKRIRITVNNANVSVQVINPVTSDVESSYSIELSTPFGDSSGNPVTVEIDEKGTLTPRTIVSKFPSLSRINPEFDCVTTGRTYIRTGNWNGSECR